MGFAQAPNELSDYTAAVAHPKVADRLSALDSFVRRASAGPLKTAALTYLVWQYETSGDHARALNWSSQLEVAEPDNALALAMIANSRRSDLMDKAAAQQLLAMADRGLASLAHLQRPLGMPEAEYTELRRRSEAMLKGTAGEAELSRKNYPGARNDLRDALAISPDDPKNTYALARAYLDGKDADPKQGYWYLARAVNLSRGTPDGQHIAQYARARYMHEGGTDAAWDQFLAAARVPGQPLTGGTEVASAQPAPQPNGTIAKPQPKENPPEQATAQKTKVQRPKPQKEKDKESAIWADNNPQQLPVRRKRPTASTSGPVSIGILIETSLTTKENRAALINSLADMVRHLGDEDEAFILTYDNNLVFEEDLTGDPGQLEKAFSRIKPQKGAVLDDAVAFAAGHLARIAKNPRRELLVISDGRNIDSQNSPLRTSAEINAAGVRIYCLGMEVSELDGQRRLQALSASTGGKSDFVSDPGQLRRATIQLAQNMGIDFRF